jgi:putative oxidoreductase
MPFHTGTEVSSATDDLAKLVLRATLAILVLFHGISKIFGGIGHISGMLGKLGMPEAFGYLVYIGEVVAPLLVLLGIWTRLAALVIAINMIVAIMLVHTHEIMTLSKTGGWALELQGFFLMTALVVAIQGAGRYSIEGRKRRRN